MSDADDRARIALYLDGRADARERARLERALVEDHVARAFAEELLLRDLLRHTPPEDPPDAVLARWQGAVLDELAAEAGDTPGWFSQAVSAVGWTLRGPAMPIRAAGGDSARLGRATLRYGLPGRSRPRKAWWRRALTWRPR